MSTLTREWEIRRTRRLVLALAPVANIRFDAWADRYLAGLEREPSTVMSYGHTMGYAKEAFGSKIVRRLSTEDVKRMQQVMKEAGSSDSTRAKHLRVLTACLNSAIANGYASRNPARELPKGEGPRPPKRESAYFTNDEIPRLFEAIEHGVYCVLFLVALKTGMRLGELLAMRWCDIDLIDGVIHVRRSWTGGRLTAPKNHEKREVHLSDDVVDLLGEW